MLKLHLKLLIKFSLLNIRKTNPCVNCSEWQLDKRILIIFSGTTLSPGLEKFLLPVLAGHSMDAQNTGNIIVRLNK